MKSMNDFMVELFFFHTDKKKRKKKKIFGDNVKIIKVMIIKFSDDIIMMMISLKSLKEKA